MNAEAYLQAYYLHEGIITLLHHRQIFYGWRGTHYAEITEEEFTASIWGFLRLGWELEELPSGDIVEVPFKVRITDVRETIAALTALSQISGELKFPLWTGGEGAVPATEVLSCANGLLHNADPRGALASVPQRSP